MSLMQAGLQISSYVYIYNKQFYYFIIVTIQTPTTAKVRLQKKTSVKEQNNKLRIFPYFTCMFKISFILRFKILLILLNWKLLLYFFC